MDRTKEALAGSIKKWEQIVAGEIADEGAWNCPLCLVFRTTFPSESDCYGCPIFENTGEKYCKDTPYGVWDEYFGWHYVTKHNDRKAYNKKTKQLAQTELDFLKELYKKLYGEDI
jgi:hypothetical protein